MVASTKCAIRRIAFNRPGTAPSHTRSSNGVSSAHTSRSRYRTWRLRKSRISGAISSSCPRAQSGPYQGDGTRLPGGRACRGAPGRCAALLARAPRAPRPSARKRTFPAATARRPEADLPLCLYVQEASASAQSAGEVENGVFAIRDGEYAQPSAPLDYASSFASIRAIFASHHPRISIRLA